MTSAKTERYCTSTYNVTKTHDVIQHLIHHFNIIKIAQNLNDRLSYTHKNIQSQTLIFKARNDLSKEQISNRQDK